LTLRENTEWSVTVEIGTNQVVGMGTERIVAAFRKVISGWNIDANVPLLWDGRTAERIVKILLDKI
jgi:UDP-N-acetylglucosamine 2-epimerase (non-hydrolysing)